MNLDASEHLCGNSDGSECLCVCFYAERANPATAAGPRLARGGIALTHLQGSDDAFRATTGEAPAASAQEAFIPATVFV